MMNLPPKLHKCQVSNNISTNKIAKNLVGLPNLSLLSVSSLNIEHTKKEDGRRPKTLTFRGEIQMESGGEGDKCFSKKFNFLFSLWVDRILSTIFLTQVLCELYLISFVCLVFVYLKS